MSDESWVTSDSDGSAHDSSLITHHSSLAAVRLGLDRVRSLNEEVSAAIVAERERHGPFRDLEDFIGRTAACGLKRPAMENLILLGAFPSFELNRRELLWQYGLLEQTRREKKSPTRRATTVGAGLPRPTEYPMRRLRKSDRAGQPRPYDEGDEAPRNLPL